MRQVAATTTITWDSSTITVPAGTVLDVQPGSALETAFGGAGNVPALSSMQQGLDQAVTAN